ncbi:4973_t:CDS:2, partial [Dentiscutata erythropus]
IENYSPIPATYNGVLFFNPLNIDEANQTIQKFQYFDRIELLTIHIYDNAIIEQKDERSMKNIQVINIQEQPLKSTLDYITALSIITDIPSLYKYLDQNILPVIAD